MYVSDREIEKIIFNTLDLNVIGITAFTAGDYHYVYDVKTESGSVVLRFSTPESFEYLKGSIYWLNSLKKKGVRVPEVLYVNDSLEDFKYYFIIIERLNGCDLGYVYPELNLQEKSKLANKVNTIQERVSNISKSKYPGKKFLPTDKLKKQSWYEYIVDISDIAYNLENKSLFDYGKITQFEEIAFEYKNILEKVEVKAYLDDLTIKNVIVDRGVFSGIVDIDYLSYGDNIMPIALTKLMLMKADYELSYVEFLCHEKNLEPEQYRLLDLYMLRYCLEFMAEIGCKYKENNKLDYRSEIDLLNRLFDYIKKNL